MTPADVSNNNERADTAVHVIPTEGSAEPTEGRNLMRSLTPNAARNPATPKDFSLRSKYDSNS
jgi:hypothetical protein